MGKLVRDSTVKAAGEIEEGLALLSAQIQQQGAPLAELEDSKVFTIDRTGREGAASVKGSKIRLTVDEILRPKSHFSVPSQKAPPKRAKIVKIKASKVKAANTKSVDNGLFDIWSDAVRPRVQAVPPELPAVKAVPAPHPGTSYNPDASSHQELVQQVVDEEMRKIEKQARFKAQVAPIFANASEDGAMPVCFDDDDESVEKTTIQEPRSTTEKRKKRTTREERRRHALQERLEAQARQEAKNARLQAAQLCNLRSINRQVQRELQTQEGKPKQMRKPLLGPCKYHPPPKAVKLSADNDLRSLVPEGNLIEERFKSLQERTLIEPRMRVRLQKRKFALKAYEKHTYKRFQ